MYRSRAFRIHLTHSQARIISKIIGAQRFSYNWAVERLQTDTTKTRFDLCTEFTATGDTVAAGNGEHIPKHRYTSDTRRCGHIQQVWERQPKVPLQETYTCHIMRHTTTIHGQPYRVIAGAWHGQAARRAAIHAGATGEGNGLSVYGAAIWTTPTVTRRPSYYNGEPVSWFPRGQEWSSKGVNWDGPGNHLIRYTAPDGNGARTKRAIVPRHQASRSTGDTRVIRVLLWYIIPLNLYRKDIKRMELKYNFQNPHHPANGAPRQR